MLGVYVRPNVIGLSFQLKGSKVGRRQPPSEVDELNLLSGRAFSADPSDGGAEGAEAEADAPRAATASSDVSYGVNGNPVMASSSLSSTHEATVQSSPAGASFGRRDPDPASPSSSFSQYEGSEQASRDDEEMATLTLPPDPSLCLIHTQRPRTSNLTQFVRNVVLRRSPHGLRWSRFADQNPTDLLHCIDVEHSLRWSPHGLRRIRV
ncbi:hypothetical protein THAOC_37193, partial [Thalassiosira oceanica]